MWTLSNHPVAKRILPVDKLFSLCGQLSVLASILYSVDAKT